MRQRRIKYGIDTETGLVWSKIGSEVAVPILNYPAMTPANNFQTSYFLEKMDVLKTLPSIKYVNWTRKIPLSIKNIHREFWGMKKLTRKPLKYEEE